MVLPLVAIHSITVDVLLPVVQSARPLSIFLPSRCNPPGPCRCFSSHGAIHSTTVDILLPVVQSARPLSMFWPSRCNPPGPCRCFSSPLGAIHSTTVDVLHPCGAIRPAPVDVLTLFGAIRPAPVDVSPPLVQSTRHLSMFCPSWCNPLNHCQCLALPRLDASPSSPTVDCFDPFDAIRSAQ